MSVCMAIAIGTVFSTPSSHAVGETPDTPEIVKISTKKTSSTRGTVTVRLSLASYDKKTLLNSVVQLGNKSCNLSKATSICTSTNVVLGSRITIRARSKNRNGFSYWSDSVRYLVKNGNTWSSIDSTYFPSAPVNTIPTVFTTTPTPVTTASTSTSTSTTSSTSTTTTTLPYCVRNPVPLKQIVFGRAWLDGYNAATYQWKVPGADQASRYGAYPAATMQPSICQTFSFTGLQARATTSTGEWAFVPYTITTSSSSAYAVVRDVWGVNMDFRYVYEVYSMTTQQWEVTYIWYSPYSCGYTCDSINWTGRL